MRCKHCAIKFLTIVLAILMMSPCFVRADNNQGLSWGVEEGDRIDYSYSTHDSQYDRTTLHDFYVIVNELSPIPENVTVIWSIWLIGIHSNFTPYYLNGTPADSYDSGHYLVCGYPVGNWSFIQDFVSQGWQGIDVEWTNTETEWGYVRHSSGDDGNRLYEGTYTCLYSKIDGLINKHGDRTEYSENDGSTYVHEWTLTRIGYGLEYVPIVLIGVGLSIVTLVVLYMKKKRKVEVPNNG